MRAVAEGTAPTRTPAGKESYVAVSVKGCAVINRGVGGASPVSTSGPDYETVGVPPRAGSDAPLTLNRQAVGKGRIPPQHDG